MSPWQKARETREHFLAVPIAEKTDIVKIVFVPFDFFVSFRVWKLELGSWRFPYFPLRTGPHVELK